jgi:hypothetical protein
VANWELRRCFWSSYRLLSDISCFEERGQAGQEGTGVSRIRLSPENDFNHKAELGKGKKNLKLSAFAEWWHNDTVFFPDSAIEMRGEL